MMDSKESHNYYKLVYIVLDIVSEALRDVFRNEWNSLYAATPWMDDTTSLLSFQAKTNVRNLTRDSSRHYNNITSGNCKTWDITLLNYALVYSHPIDLINKPAKAVVCTAVGKLKDRRNNLAHMKGPYVTDADFRSAYDEIKTEIRNFGPFCNRYVHQLKQAKHEDLSGAEIKRMENRIAIERNKRQKELYYQRLERALFTSFILIILACLYLLYVIFVPPALPSFFPAIPSKFNEQMTVIPKSVDAVNDGYRAVILHGPQGHGQHVSALIAGQRIRKQWQPFPWYIVASVSFDDAKDISILQKKILEAFFIYSETQISHTIKHFFAHVLRRRTLMIINNAESILQSEVGFIVRDLLIDILSWNKGLQIIVTCSQPLNFIDYKYINIPVDNLTSASSNTILHSIAPSLDDTQLKHIDEACKGVIVLVKSVGVIIKHSAKNFDSASLHLLNKGNHEHEKRNDNVLSFFFSLLQIDLQVVALSMWYPKSVAIFKLKQSFPTAESFITDIVSVGLGQITNTLGGDEMWSSDVLLHTYARHLCEETQVTQKFNYLEEHCRNMDDDFQYKYMTLVLHYSNKLWFANDTDTGQSQITIPLNEQLHVKKMFSNGRYNTDFMSTYYKTLEKSSSFFFFGIQEEIFSRHVFYEGTDLYRDLDIGKFMTLLFLQSERGDIYSYNHPIRNPYEKVTRMILDSLNLFEDREKCEGIESMKERGMCFLMHGQVKSLYQSKKEFQDKLSFNKEDGLRLIDESVKIFSDNNLIMEKVFAIQTKALVHVSIEKYSTALSLYTEAHILLLQMFHTKNIFLASNHFNIALCFYKMAKFNIIHAVQHFWESFLIYNRTIGLHRRTANSAFFHGLGLQALGRYTESMKSLSIAYDTQNQVIMLHTDISRAPMDKAELLWMKNVYDQTKNMLSQNLQIVVDTINNDLSTSFNLYILGNCYVSISNWQMAEVNFKMAEQMLYDLCQNNKQLCSIHQSVNLDISATLSKKDASSVENAAIHKSVGYWDLIVYVLTVMLYAVILLFATLLFLFVIVARYLTI